MASDTLCAALVSPIEPERLSDVALSPAIPPFPVPLNTTLCGEPTTESLKNKVALLVPFAVGANITETAQFAAAANDDPQVVEI